ncbi:MAG: hypothetical protein Q8P67_24640 [archaeon]|nr:hypothetical protein [archaeon]
MYYAPDGREFFRGDFKRTEDDQWMASGELVQPETGSGTPAVWRQEEAPRVLE